MNPDPTNPNPTPAVDCAPNPTCAAFTRPAFHVDPRCDLLHIHPLYPPEMPEPAHDFDIDDDGSERVLLLDDLASDSEDFSRSDEDGWFYSDED